MNLVDSSAWLEYFADGPNASFFSRAIEYVDELVVPSLTIYDAFKRVFQGRGEGDALRAIAVMQQGQVADLDARIALAAARVSVEAGLPMADSMVLATTRAYEATLWTQDADLQGMAGVQYRRKKA